MASSFTPLTLTLVELGNAQVLIRVFFIVLKNYLGVLVHLLMRLSNYKCILALASQNEEFNCFLLCSLRLAVVCYHKGTLGQLTLVSEDLL